MSQNQSLNTKGYKIIDSVISPRQIEKVKEDLKRLQLENSGGGIRNIEKKSVAVARLIPSRKIIDIVEKLLPGKAALVRAIAFNKTPEQNWAVPWHQDKTVCVSERFDRDGWHNWSIKDGSVHVHPPREILEAMITLRLHLDAADEHSACLRVIPGSHASGVLKQAAISEISRNTPAENCITPAGSALIMRPLLLHASAKLQTPSPRRVIHLEFCNYELPAGVHWISNGSV